MGVFDSFDNPGGSGTRDERIDEVLERLERIEKKLDVLIGAGREETSSGQDELESEVMALMHKNRKIEAIKYHREKTGAGLKESKEYVESLWQRRR